MIRPPDDPPSKSKITPEERRARDTDRVATIRLWMAIGRALEERGTTTPAAIAEALGLLLAEATRLMTGKHWRPGEIAQLQAVAARLGLPGLG